MPEGAYTDRWQQILVVDSDPSSVAATETALNAGGYPHVTITTDPNEGAELLRRGTFDLLLTERSFSGYEELDLLQIAHSCDKRLPVVVMTADNDVATAIEALRLRAADFLVKPVDPGVLVERLDKVLRDRSSRRGREVVLAVGAHPDDVEVGAGAALLAHRARGDRVAILIMSVGERGGMALVRKREAAVAADLLGAELLLGNLEDTRVPDHGPSVELIEDSIAWSGATRVYTHSASDHHQDHRNTHRATMIAARRLPRVYGFQSPSSTIDYRPTRFESIDDKLAQKLELIACHRSQSASRDYLDEDFIVATARYWGRFGASRYAEAFEVLRDVQGHILPATEHRDLAVAMHSEPEPLRLAEAEPVSAEEFTEAI